MENVTFFMCNDTGEDKSLVLQDLLAHMFKLCDQLSLRSLGNMQNCKNNKGIINSKYVHTQWYES